VPSSVKVELDANRVKVEGPKGTLERTVPAQVSVKLEGDQILCERPTAGR
jgi:large subunit ribosomal protein L6